MPSGICEQPSGEETLEIFCERVRSDRCRDLADCESIVQPTDGCCPICGKHIPVATLLIILMYIAIYIQCKELCEWLYHYTSYKLGQQHACTVVNRRNS